MFLYYSARYKEFAVKVTLRVFEVLAELKSRGLETLNISFNLLSCWLNSSEVADWLDLGEPIQLKLSLSWSWSWGLAWQYSSLTLLCDRPPTYPPSHTVFRMWIYHGWQRSCGSSHRITTHNMEQSDQSLHIQKSSIWCSQERTYILCSKKGIQSDYCNSFCSKCS